MTATAPNRVPAGIPTGGRFAPKRRGRVAVGIGTNDDVTPDAVMTYPLLPNAYPLLNEDDDEFIEHAAQWRSTDPHVPDGFCIDAEFNCLTNADNLCDLDPGLVHREGWTRLGDSDQWGAHAWAETADGAVVDPYLQWRFPGREIQYRRAGPHDDPFGAM